MIVLIDNYDSFSFNLYQQLGALLMAEAAASGSAPEDIRVIRNDAMTAADILALGPSRLVLSPGPGRPADAGVCVELIAAAAGRLPLLGVCLGHQAICEAYGATVSYALELVHGKAWPAALDTGCPLFAGLPNHIDVARYHSLAALDPTLPDCLRVTARTADGEIMAVAHRDHPVYGLQFHPESILTPRGD
ncbi:MAG: aminodeoxychorismate/anthranilate synthase component II, partial [Propionibacteriaceae bacterium]|nr:aminodeoxychorismate/anthranilate synthase component II [Propionibacteriaceae bacterium]